MQRRGNKPASIVAKTILVLILVMVVVIIWLGVRGFQREPNGPLRGSQSLPAQAAQGTAQPVTPEVQSAH
jgi:hypothetical protein